MQSHDDIQKQHRAQEQKDRDKNEARSRETRANISRLAGGVAAGAIAGAGARAAGVMVAKKVDALGAHLSELKAATERHVEISRQQLDLEKQRIELEANEATRLELMRATKNDLHLFRQQLDSILEENSNVVRYLKLMSMAYSLDPNSINILEDLPELVSLLDDFSDKDYASKIVSDWKRSRDSTRDDLSDSQIRDVDYYQKLATRSLEICNKQLEVLDEWGMIQTQKDARQLRYDQANNELNNYTNMKFWCWLGMVCSGVLGSVLVLLNIAIVIVKGDIGFRWWPNMCLFWIAPPIVFFVAWFLTVAGKEAMEKAETIVIVENPMNPDIIRRSKKRSDVCKQKSDELAEYAGRAMKAYDKFLQKYPTSEDLIRDEICFPEMPPLQT